MSALFRTVGAAALASLALAGCRTADVMSDATDATALQLTSGTAVFVLDRVEQQVGAPLVVLDLPCASGRVRHLVQDTIALDASGGMRRVSVLRREMRDALLDQSTTETVGTWTTRGTNIAITARLENGRALGTYEVALHGGPGDVQQLTMRSGVGGSCAGVANTAREAEFQYRRID